MQRWMGQMIDSVALRVQMRSSQLSRRTTWPSDEELASLRAGTWRPSSLDDPGPPPDVVRQPLGGGPSGADEWFSFPSSRPYAQDHDRAAGGLLYLPRDSSESSHRGAVLIAPGAFTGHFGSVNRTYDRVGRAFADSGMVAVRLMMPLHERRSPPGELSGHNMYQGDHFTLARAVAQSVRDARSAAGWLLDEFGAVGFWGFSLGAAVGALVLSHDDRWSFGVLMALPLFPASGLHSPVTRQLVNDLASSGVTTAEIKTVVRTLAPLERPAIETKRVLLQGGRWDRLAAAEGTLELSERWGCPVEWYRDGHIALTLGRRWLRDGVSFGRQALDQAHAQTISA